jgi:hypothetical protein
MVASRELAILPRRGYELHKSSIAYELNIPGRFHELLKPSIARTIF